MPGRTFNSDNYRYSFNGKEKDKNWTNTNSHLDFGARIYDSRLGRWFATVYVKMMLDINDLQGGIGDAKAKFKPKKRKKILTTKRQINKTIKSITKTQVSSKNAKKGSVFKNKKQPRKIKLYKNKPK